MYSDALDTYRILLISSLQADCGRATALVAVIDNLDLQARRKRLGLTQTDLAALLGVADYTRLSRFETSNRALPNNLTRSDVERVLDTYERGMKAASK